MMPLREDTLWLVIIALFALHSQGLCQELTMDPDQAQLVTSDLTNFWLAYDKADKATGQERVQIFEEEYFARGSVGLRDFIQLRISNAAELVAAIDKYPYYYRSIRASTLHVTTMEPQIRQCFVTLKALYPEAVFPDVYFVIGRMNSGGTTSDHGLLIGTEIFARAPASPLEELEEYLQQAVKPIDKIPTIVAHELIHYEQHYHQALTSTLLVQSIREGSADFIGELISGDHINQHVYAYGYAHERELWDEFRQEIASQDPSKWLYNGLQSKERPGDLGYFIGYRICQAYYEHAADKRQAIREILTIQDVQQFLQASRYEERFR